MDGPAINSLKECAATRPTCRRTDVGTEPRHWESGVVVSSEKEIKMDTPFWIFATLPISAPLSLGACLCVMKAKRRHPKRERGSGATWACFGAVPRAGRGLFHLSIAPGGQRNAKKSR